MRFLTLNDVGFNRKVVLVRLDLNLPTQGNTILDDTRLTRSLPTLQHLIHQGAICVILSHLGRPQSAQECYSLRPVCDRLRQHCSQNIVFVDDCLSPHIPGILEHAHPGDIIFLENLRFYKAEEANDPQFSEKLASYGDLYVNDAFSCSHRAHASITGIPQYLPSIAGNALQDELQALTTILGTPRTPIMGIVGGSKVSTKVALLENLIHTCDILFLGGGMANTFLAAQGHDIGRSFYEAAHVTTAQHILRQAEGRCKILLPQDVGVVTELSQPETLHYTEVRAVQSHERIIDVGSQTLAQLEKTLDTVHTAIWNGPLGVFEEPAYATGSITCARLLAQRCQSGTVRAVAGGGDTLAVLSAAGCAEDLTYTSTAGGAFLQWLEGEPLPGLVALERWQKK